jgi:hypothetical protein
LEIEHWTDEANTGKNNGVVHTRKPETNRTLKEKKTPLTVEATAAGTLNITLMKEFKFNSMNTVAKEFDRNLTRDPKYQLVTI